MQRSSTLLRCCAVLIGSIASVVASSTQAMIVTGDPSVDSGWSAGGNSGALGTYVRGSGLFEYDTYYTGFALQAGSNLVAGNWAVGDTIVGLGGAITNANAINLTQSVRIVAKFGTDPTSWEPSTTVVPPGDGQGSTSAGHGGVGSILLATLAPGVQTVVPANAGLLLTPANSFRYTPAEAAVNADIGRIIFTVTTPAIPSEGELKTWQVFLNTTRLATVLGLPQNDPSIPILGDAFIATLQRSSSSTLFTDAMVTVAVPEVSSFAFFGLVGVVAYTANRFRKARTT
jgi:hypothetical protein